MTVSTSDTLDSGEHSLSIYYELVDYPAVTITLPLKLTLYSLDDPLQTVEDMEYTVDDAETIL